MERRLRRSALVAYGSETGNACECAQELGQIVRRLHFSCTVISLDATKDISLSLYTILLVVTSTTGQGDVPLNAKSFWKHLLRSKLRPDYLNSVVYAAFGLGDSSYPRFNWAVRKLEKRLLQLGASPLCARGEADEQHPEGSDAAFVPWAEGLQTVLLQKYPLETGITPMLKDEPLPPQFQLEERTETTVQNGGRYGEEVSTQYNSLGSNVDVDVDKSSKSSARREKIDIETPLNVKILDNRRLTPRSHWQDVRHIVLSTEKRLIYGPGDILAIAPENDSKDVENMMRLMEWTHIADTPLQLKSNDEADGHGRSIPFEHEVLDASTTTLRALLTHALDITAIPRRSFFSAIACFARDEAQKERILDFTNPEYIDWLHDYTTRPRRTIFEVLTELDSVKIPWKWVLDVFPPLRNRQFSIASGGALKTCHETGNTRFELLVAIVKYRTIIRRIRTGVCTRYLANLPVGTRVRARLIKGSLGSTIRDPEKPLIMVGPGTGLAPLRSLIHERKQLLDNLNPQLPTDDKGNGQVPQSELVLFFGGRNKDADYFYREEWETLKEHVPLQVFTAFSRDQHQKIYVQDLIRKESKLVCRLLHEKGGILLVCGSSGNMPKAVRQAVIDAFVKDSTQTLEEAEKYLERMELQGRYLQETWS